MPAASDPAALPRTWRPFGVRMAGTVLGVGLLVVAAVLYGLEAGGPSFLGVPLSAWVAGVGGIWALLAALPRRGAGPGSNDQRHGQGRLR